jgi:hypothetical protein
MDLRPGPPPIERKAVNGLFEVANGAAERVGLIAGV